ncbi:MAG: Na/Pi cotransporter family protein [Clostridia bacterium]|nr:Na/Pi cotransporter family protein [Clostridia bacterium]
MDIFDVLTMIGGLCLFLFGMDVMGQALERRAGNSLKALLGKLTTGKWIGLLTGLGVTAIIQSSSATTVMVVGFVNSGLMTLGQAINVIMGANIGTTATAWILSLGGIDSGNIVMQLLKPTSFTPVLALIGVVFTMFSKNGKKKDTGMILLGFATLMFGMDTMSGAVKGLASVPQFQQLFILFKNPVLGVVAGAVLTAIIQSSSASVGILQALSATGQVSFAAAIPIIMGQNIGTCITAILSSVGANKNARRAALVHLSFNIIGTIIMLAVFIVVNAIIDIPMMNDSATHFGIAVCHSIFNVCCTAILLPMSGLLEKLAYKLVPEGKQPEAVVMLDDRLLATPPLALERCHNLSVEMAKYASDSITEALNSLAKYSSEQDAKVRELEDKTDKYEDALGTYLVKLSSHQISVSDSAEAAKLLRIIGDLERIGDHSVNILASAEELYEKKISFSAKAARELNVLKNAITEILSLSVDAFVNNDLVLADRVEPLEQVIDDLSEEIRKRHIARLQKGECSIEQGFVLNDLLTNLERVSDHCSNIAGCVIDLADNNMNLHETLRDTREHSAIFATKYKAYAETYSINFD